MCLTPEQPQAHRIFDMNGAYQSLYSGRGGADARSTAILALDGDKRKPRPVYRTRQGGNGFGINYGQVMYTLNTVDKHIVAIL